MKVNSFKSVVCVLLALVFCVGVVVMPTAAASGSSAANANLEETKMYLAADTYAEYLNRYTQAGISAGDQVYTATPDLANSADDAYLLDATTWSENLGADAADYREGAFYSPADGSTTFTVDVGTTGMYYIVIEYYTVAETVNSIERKLFIDGDIPFQETAQLSLTKTWSYQYEEGTEFRKDLNGNDLTPTIAQSATWRSYFCSDSDGYSNEYFRFYMTAGTHTLKFESIRESMVIGSVKLVPIDAAEYGICSYQEYLAKILAINPSATDASASAKVTLQAEKPYAVSDSSVVMSSNKSSSINQPSSPSASLYNVIGGTSYNSVGQWAAYQFTVPETGLYNITLRYLQSTLDGMFVSRAIKISSNGQGTYKYGLSDGTPTVPFTEAFSTRYNYSKDWEVGAVGDGTDTFKFYFEQGVTYTVYFEVSLGALAEQLQRVENALSVLNDCYLKILKLTGTDPDEYSDYGFSTLLPDVIWYLNYEAVELQDVRDELARICGGETGSHVANLDKVIRLVATMGTDETKIAANLSNLKTYLGTLGTWISDSKTSTLVVDYITIQSPEAELGRGKAGFFSSVWYEIRSFFSSFFTNYNQMGVTNEAALASDALSVWHATGRDQSNVMRNLIDSYFADYCESDSSYTGGEIAVSLKLVTGGTLLPSILAGSGPDVYLGLDATTLMNYAIREAILEVSDMDGFDTVIGEFHQAAKDAITLLGKTYGLPQTMSFAMMFYRYDSLVELNATVPETWDELLGLLPVMQANNMEIGLNYTLALDFFLYQNGGNMWRYIDDTEYQGAQIGLDTDAGLSAFEFCTSLYTDYSFPVTFDAANRFRTGEMPITIQDYVGGYNMLVVYATELSGLWSFSHIPGMLQYDSNGKALLNDDGTQQVNYTAIANVSVAAIPKTGEARKRQAWEYLKWVTGAQYTSEYANRMIAILGPSAKYAGANMKSLDDMSWTSQELAAIREQMDHLDAIVPYPGSYIISRYTQFAFYSVVNDGEDAVEALRSYISAINSEITRKREEFGMATLEQGETPPTSDVGQ
jgi:maltose-binding protein MalE